MKNKVQILTIGLLLSIIITGCSSNEKTRESVPIETITVNRDQMQPFVSFEEDSIARPQDIEVLPDGNVAILDSKLNTVFLFNQTGEQVTRFGRTGRGPGEFQSAINLEQAEGHIYVYDQAQFLWKKFTNKGELVTSLKNVGGGIVAGDVKIIAEDKYLIPANGKQQSLALFKNTSTNETHYFGAAMGDSLTMVSLEENAQQARNGEVPNLFKNMVYLAHHDEAFFVFLKSYARLIKYDRSGNLLWDKKLDFPFINQIHEEYVEANTNRKENNLPMLLYARDMKTANNTIFLLMRAPSGQKQVLLKIDSNGNTQKRDNFDYPDGNFNALAIAKAADIIYFVDTSLARVLSLKLQDLE